MIGTVNREKGLAALKDRISGLLVESGRVETAVPGLALSRFNGDVAGEKCFYSPMAALVVQGVKRSMVGSREVRYGEGQCMALGVDMPGVYQIAQTSKVAPFLSLSVKLERRIVSELVAEMPSLAASPAGGTPPVAVAKADGELLEAFVRLVDLLKTPSRIPVFAPMILREIHFHLLAGAFGSCLRLFGSGSTQAGRIALAISWLRENYAAPLDVAELAGRVNMAPSTFNRHFRQVTGLSPLQFRTQLRLYEAERLMLVEGMYAAQAALKVGYESGSQFSREYRRHFGAPPRRDVAGKRA